ncbi:MAG: hypothetical protein ACK54X_08065 [Burkholderiales bacterium]|jgi:hypothetical protein
MDTPPDRPAGSDRRAAVAHPSLQRTLRAALELTARDLPEFDAGLRRMLVARYRADEGAAAATPASRAKANLLAHEAAFRSTLPRIVALGLNTEFQRLDGAPALASRPEDGATPRAAMIAAFGRGFAVDHACALEEFECRLAHQLGRPLLAPGQNPMRPAVFLHAVGACWRAVSGTDRDEVDVMHAYGTLWVPSLRRTIAALVAGLPPVPGRVASAPATHAAPAGGSVVERWAAAMGTTAELPRPAVAEAPRAAAPPRMSPETVERLRAGFGVPTRDPRASPA